LNSLLESLSKSTNVIVGQAFEIFRGKVSSPQAQSALSVGILRCEAAGRGDYHFAAVVHGKPFELRRMEMTNNLNL
jgi:hypothetical protein